MAESINGGILNEPVIASDGTTVIVYDGDVPHIPPVYVETTGTYAVGVGGVNACQVVYMLASNAVCTANTSNETHAGRVVGVALANALNGDNVVVQLAGVVINHAWVLESGAVHYFDDGGNVTPLVPTAGFIQKIGIALNTTTLLIQIGSPILLG